MHSHFSKKGILFLCFALAMTSLCQAFAAPSEEEMEILRLFYKRKGPRRLVHQASETHLPGGGEHHGRHGKRDRGDERPYGGGGPEPDTRRLHQFRPGRGKFRLHFPDLYPGFRGETCPCAGGWGGLEFPEQRGRRDQFDPRGHHRADRGHQRTCVVGLGFIPGRGDQHHHEAGGRRCKARGLRAGPRTARKTRRITGPRSRAGRGPRGIISLPAGRIPTACCPPETSTTTASMRSFTSPLQGMRPSA